MKRRLRLDLLDFFKKNYGYIDEFNGAPGWEEPIDVANLRGVSEPAYFNFATMSCYIGEEVDLAPYDGERSFPGHYDWQLIDPEPLLWAFLEEWLEPV